jgi:hypothetical protein
MAAAHLDALTAAIVATAPGLGWSVYVRAAGQVVRIGPLGRPGRALIISLGPGAEDAEEVAAIAMRDQREEPLCR